MATSLSPFFQPITIISSSSSSSSSSSTNRLKPAAAAKWWTPIFNLSPDPDYIHNPVPEQPNRSVTEISDLENTKSRFAPGCFTEEKAKQLRIKTVESANFHDIMYHSAIASRLASHVSDHRRL